MRNRGPGSDAPGIVTVDILGMAADGEGVARLEGEELLVPLVIPGERVEVTVRRRHDDALIGEVVRVVSPSPDRVTPRCCHFGECGGCAWQHVSYPAQLRLKQSMLQSMLAATMGASVPAVRPTVPTPPREGQPGPSDAPAEPWGYRDKVSFVFAPAGHHHLVMGHYRRGTRHAFDARECPVHSEAGNQVAFRLRDALLRAAVPAASADGRDGIARHVVVRVAEGTGDRLATLVVTENVMPLRRVTGEMERFERPGRPPGPSPRSQGPRPEGRGQAPAAGQAPARFGFHLNLHGRADGFLFGRETKRLFGPMEIRETLAGVTFLLSPTSFFQTNVRVAALVVDHVLRLLPAESYPRVLDLYSGVGLFALPLARRGQEVTAVEENRHAVAAADAAVRFNRLSQGVYRAVTGRVESVISRLSPGPASRGWDAVVLDPPRQGCEPQVFDWAFHTVRPRRVIYVSCNPRALAANLARVPADYAIEDVTPYDMFPHTAHIEAVASIVLKS